MFVPVKYTLNIVGSIQNTQTAHISNLNCVDVHTIKIMRKSFSDSILMIRIIIILAKLWLHQ